MLPVTHATVDHPVLLADYLSELEFRLKYFSSQVRAIENGQIYRA